MSKQENISNKAKAFAEIPGMSSGVIGSAENYADNVILGAERGHGFAAEKANHLHDVFTGKDAKIVGGDNVKNGADRLVDGVYIQTKYCNSGSKCIAEAFENGQFRYWNADGTPMQIEVPSDMYESAIQAMEERIKKGQVAGVTDPAKAKEIVRKGNYTYAQVRNIARFGTIESITYDAVNGIKIAGTAMGISSAISFAVSIWNGEQWDIALENACYDGLKVGGIAWVSSLLTAQLGRTGIEQGLRGGTDWVVRQMGPKAAAWLANGLRSGSNIYGAAAMNHVSKLLRGNIVTGVVVTFVLSSVDFVRIFNGRVSGAQLFKNVTTNAASVAGGTGGWMGGAAAGAAIGSAIPILGTAAGGIIGGILGSLAGGFAASTATSSILDTFIEDDAKEMLKKIEAVFGQLAEDYLLTEKEAKLVIDEFQQRDMPDTLRDMYASNNRHEFARNILEPLIEGQAKNRKKIKLPDDSEVIKQVANIIENLAAAPA
jgi:gas vesicle protein